MKVILKNDWFGPGGEFFPRDPVTDEEFYVFPEDFRSLLPSRAVILAEDGTPEPRVSRDTTPAPAPALRDFDWDREAAEAEQAVRDKADVFRAQALAGTKKPRTSI